MEHTQTPVISVIIPCFNAVDVLGMQLHALATQADAPPFEVLLVDNRSSDDLETRRAEFSDKFPGGLRLIEAMEHQGTSYARNVGAAAASSQLLMFCDADDVVSEWWVRQGLQTFEVKDFWSGSAISLTEKDFTGDLHHTRQLFGDSPEWSPPSSRPSHDVFPILMGGNFGCTRDLFFTLGGFDQSFPASGEDNDLAFRAQRQGHPVVISPTVRIGYRGWNSMKTRQRRVFRSARAHALLATRYDAWEDSHFPPLVPELLRCAGAAFRMLANPKRRDYRGLWLRVVSAIGLLWGTLEYRILRRIPDPQLGVGLHPRRANRRLNPKP